MLSIIKVTLSCIDDQRVNCTFITYENVRLLVLLKRNPRDWRRLWSSICEKQSVNESNASENNSIHALFHREFTQLSSEQVEIHKKFSDHRSIKQAKQMYLVDSVIECLQLSNIHDILSSMYQPKQGFESMYLFMMRFCGIALINNFL